MTSLSIVPTPCTLQPEFAAEESVAFCLLTQLAGRLALPVREAALFFTFSTSMTVQPAI
jgi:hypothetical protein